MDGVYRTRLYEAGDWSSSKRIQRKAQPFTDIRFLPLSKVGDRFQTQGWVKMVTDFDW